MPLSRRLTPLALLLCGALAAQTVPTSPQAPATEDPRSLLLQGRALQLRGGGDNPAGAVALYRKVIQAVPESAEAHLRLSEALAETGDLDAALPPARRAVELNPRGLEAAANLGLLAYKRAQTNPALLPEAKAALLRATRMLPGDPELWARLAEVGELQKDADLALQGWLRLARLQPRLPQIAGIWERVIHHARALNRYEPRREAVLALALGRNAGPADLRKPDPNHLRLLEELAKEQVQSGFLAHAEESFRILGRLLPDFLGTILENISHVQVQAGRFEEATETLRRAIALQATPRNRFNLAVCHMYLGRFKEAEPLLRDVLPDLKNGPDAQPTAGAGRALLATAVALQERPQDLLRLLGEWPETSQQAELAALKFQALVQTQNWKAARAELKADMGRFDKHPLFITAKTLPAKTFDEGLFSKKGARGAMEQLALEHRSAVLAEFRQWSESLAAARTARAATPTRVASLLLLESNALDQLGRYPEAIAALREAQKSEPENPTLQNNLGYLLLERGGDLGEAARLINAAVTRDPENSSYQDSWGWALFRQGRSEEAEKALRRASELDPFSAEIRRHLGEALLRLGREEEALEQWERALAFAFPERPALEKRFAEVQVQRAKREQQRQPEVPEAPVAEAPTADDDEDPRP